MGKWIEFKLILQKQKTKVYHVISKEEGFILGVIEWHGPWRKYSFFPAQNTVFEKTCLMDIVSFIDLLMAERKK